MYSFTETLSNFFTELINNILQEIFENNSSYREMKSENDNYCKQLQNLAPPVLLSSYIESQYALATFENNYCYLRGWTYKKNTDIINPTDDAILQELSNNKKYRQLQTKAYELYHELKAVLMPEYDDLLNVYIKTWSLLVGLEKQYCYSGGTNDKAQLNKYINPKNVAEWENLMDFFL